MNNKINRQEKNISSTGKRKIFYPILAVIILIFILSGFWFSHRQTQQAAEKAAVLQKQKAAEDLQAAKKNSGFSRPSFFLSAPKGARGSFNVPLYLLGFWRMSDTNNVDKKMTILYVKNPDYAAPLMYVRYDEKANFKLAAGETELKSNSRGYSFAYYFYPLDSYSGPDKGEFSAMQKDFQVSLTTFGAS